MKILRTVSDVLECLGGLTRVSRLLTDALGKPYSIQTIFYWRGRSNRFPDRETYPVILRALEKMGYVPDPALWGFSAKDFDHVVETARGIRQFYTGVDAGGMTGLSGLIRVATAAPRGRRQARRETARRGPPAKDRQMQLQV